MPQAAKGSIGIQRLRAFPRAASPNDDPRVVKSNLSLEDVVLCQNILAYHIAYNQDSKVFGNVQARGLKLVEIWVNGRDGPKGQDSVPEDLRKARPDVLEGIAVCELLVEEGMLNVHGTFAGACAMLMIDFVTFASLFALSPVTGIDVSGFSTAFNIVWLAPATRGMTLKIFGTTLSLKGRMASARCEVYDKNTGTLIISATHVVAPVRGLPVVVAAKPGDVASAKL